MCVCVHDSESDSHANDTDSPPSSSSPVFMEVENDESTPSLIDNLTLETTGSVPGSYVYIAR